MSRNGLHRAARSDSRPIQGPMKLAGNQARVRIVRAAGRDAPFTSTKYRGRKTMKSPPRLLASSE